MFERSGSRSLPARALAASALILVTGLGACGKGDAGKAADSAAMAAAAPKPKTVAIIRAADWMGSEWSEDALKVGLQEAGLEPGRDFVFTISSAQGDLATLPSLIDAALDAKADVIVALQDETLKSAVERVKSTPVVFNVLSDPFAAGAGTSDSSHLANITGVYSPGLGDPEQARARGADPEGGAQCQAHRDPVQPARAAGGEHEGQDDGIGEGGRPDGGGGADQQPDRGLGSHRRR